MTIGTNVLNEILPNGIQHYIKMIIHYNQVGFIPQYKDGSAFTNQCDVPR